MRRACFDIGHFSAKRPPRSKVCEQKTLILREAMRILRFETTKPITETTPSLGFDNANAQE
jgi:hypothetical protein